ncbi:uncharacterized protein LOC108195572 [Daucus carota subsp. sativus]|nr:PREDICTED: uncharacterized protein LOC108195572 [Daucus carota subsp. sativus]
MDPNLLEPIKEAQEQIRNALRLAHVTDDRMKPTAKERRRSRALSDYQLGMRHILRLLSNAQKSTFVIPESPTHVDIALVEEIDSMEQKFHNMLPPDLRSRKDETNDLAMNHEVFVKCYLDSLKELETAMTSKYNEIKTEEEAQLRQGKARAKKERRKKRASQQQEKATTPLPSPKKSFLYLYVQRCERLSRLNVTKLSEAPLFELVCDFQRSHPRDCLSPVVCFNVESDFFMVGDVFIHHKQRPKLHRPPFLDVLSVDTVKSSSFIPCPPTAPRLAGPKVDPVVVTLRGKIYVLALHPYPDQPSFEVFADEKWETLPPPPFLRCTEGDDDDEDAYLVASRNYFLSLYAWDHKIVVCLRKGMSYCFDTKAGKWTDMRHIYKDSKVQPVLQCVAEYDKFLIAKPFFSEELLVYELDADGFPQFYQNLDGLEEVFTDSRILSSSNAFIIPFDDDADKFCFICSGPAPCTDLERNVDFFLRVVVIRMTISNLDGKKKLTAVLEAHQIYPFYRLVSSSFQQHICSAFLKRDTLNLDNLKADRSLGKPCLG